MKHLIDEYLGRAARKKLCRLIRGLVMTLRNLRGYGSDDTPVSKELAIQRFLRELESMASKMERAERERTSIRSKLRGLRLAKRNPQIRRRMK